MKTFGMGSIAYDVRMVETSDGVYWRANVTVASVATGMHAAQGFGRNPKRALALALDKLSDALKKEAVEMDASVTQLMASAKKVIDGEAAP